VFVGAFGGGLFGAGRFGVGPFGVRAVWRADLRRKEVTRAWVLEGFRGGSRKNRKIGRKVEE